MTDYQLVTLIGPAAAIIAGILLCFICFIFWRNNDKGGGAGFLTTLLLFIIGLIIYLIHVYHESDPIAIITDKADLRYRSTANIDECQLFVYLPANSRIRSALLLATTKNLKKSSINSSLSVIWEKTSDENLTDIHYNKFTIDNLPQLSRLDNAEGGTSFVATSQLSASQLVARLFSGQYLLHIYGSRGNYHVYSVNSKVTSEAASQFEACTAKLGGLFRN